MDQFWADLKVYRNENQDISIEGLFGESDRAQEFSATACGLYFDYSKTAIDTQTRQLLLELYRNSPAPALRDAMFAGQAINNTEDRAVLHTALRSDSPLMLNGVDVTQDLRETFARMRVFSDAVRGGDYRPSGEKILDVVNIGIGGSDLGPAMATRALAPFCDGPRLHFVSNVDGADLSDCLKGLSPRTTLFVIASKTFTTIETMTNAASARKWLSAEIADVGGHFAAVSTATDRTTAYGIPEDRAFGFEDWVGGRYSVWGPVGLALMIAVGADRFDEFRAGAAAMDQHFQTADAGANLPVMLALTGIWHNQICGYPTRAVLPYAERLGRLPAYLQQLEMESNGKGLDRDGNILTQSSGPVVWGEAGTNGQHAFYQLIHQGTQVVPCEFILFAEGIDACDDVHQKILLANGLAQSQALMRGRTKEAAAAGLPADMDADRAALLASHKAFPGNRPSVTLLARQLDPFTLGALVALYEHRVFVEGAILGINSFDQWGVELGKELAVKLTPLLEGEAVAGQDPSTLQLALMIRQMAAL